MLFEIEAWVAAGKALGALFTFVSNIDEKRRKTVSEYLEAIAKALEALRPLRKIGSLSEGTVPR